MRKSIMALLTAAFLGLMACVWMALQRPVTATLWIALAAGWLIVALIRHFRHDPLSTNWRPLLKQRIVRLLWLS